MIRPAVGTTDIINTFFFQFLGFKLFDFCLAVDYRTVS